MNKKLFLKESDIGLKPAWLLFSFLLKESDIGLKPSAWLLFFFVYKAN